MRITFDPDKRERTLRERGLDFADAAEVFAGLTLDRVDDRKDYGETRTITIGHLRGRLVLVAWTERGDARRVISMRMADAKEKADWERFAKGGDAPDHA